MQSEFFEVKLRDGQFAGFVDRASGTDHLPKGSPAPVLTVRVAGKDYAPTRMTWGKRGKGFTLEYDAVHVTAHVGVEAKPTHLVLELTSITPADGVELVSWGPYPTTIGGTIGETVGVVRNGAFAIGIQALNAKTLGGIPERDDDVMPSYNIFDNKDYSDISLDFKDKQLYRGNTAVAAPHGSNIQAYCRDRRRPRVIRNWGHAKYVAPAYDDGGVVGSKIALFGCPTAALMATMAAIELAEGLPHPMIDGEWAKTSKAATAAYIITDFGEQDITQAIAVTRAAGLSYLYHSAPFETWGHFRLKRRQFPRGWDGFKACVDEAAKAGIKIGFHTLSNFTTTNDPYVTPKPDPRLARIGTTTLSKGIDATVKTLVVEAPDFFRKKTTLNTVVIGDELIRYQRVSKEAPWRLLACQRGAFGTKAAPHVESSEVGKLMDHAYKVFLTNAELAAEEARRIAEFCNHTGAMQLSFDGLEGNWSTGMGQYGRTLFTQAWYEALDPTLRGRIINDASNPGHFTWHTYTRMNWGEPWYAGFRESQTLYRLKNQYYYSRNLMPRMLGWFALRGNTSIEDAEWLLARAAGFDAGFSLATSVRFAGDQILDGNDINDQGPQSNLRAILSAICEWEKARMAGVFPERLKPMLQDINREFHLEPVDEAAWDLYPVHVVRAKLHAAKLTMPFDNPHAERPLGFIITNTGKTPITGLALTTNGQTTAICDRALKPGEILTCDGQGSTVVCDANWGVLARPTPPAVPVQAKAGANALRFDWADRQAGQALKVELRLSGKPVRLGEIGRASCRERV